MGVNVALLTIYDMCKAMDRAMEIFDVHLEKKTVENPDFLSEVRKENNVRSIQPQYRLYPHFGHRPL